MGKQNEILWEEEKEWLALQYPRPDVQDALANSQKKLVKAVDIIWPDYQKRFKGPLPAESEHTFKRRLLNAPADRKKLISRRKAESVNDVTVRMQRRKKDLKEWLKKHKYYDARKKTSDSSVVIPALTPQRRRGVGAVDVFAQSPLRQELVPDPPRNVGTRRSVVAAAFHHLDPEVQATFAASAQTLNKERLAQELEEAGGEDEVTRGLKVPSISPWYHGIMQHLLDEVGWIGVAVLGGPNEEGHMIMFSYAKHTDRKGENFWQALAKEVGWDEAHLMNWALHFLEGCNPGT
ncbi:hypothetical protein C8Q73DRAFT_659653 [Cubamyces lactineus]|nr:hypothetical protein C8Q73DRAFT_661184 [Cubamyces lactineus]KAH9885586.1 hypothetical protein C8Q73DRAFT_659653 [Cubamyces lactineus]